MEVELQELGGEAGYEPHCTDLLDSLLVRYATIAWSLVKERSL